jgi:glycine cleavage system H protein
MKELSELNLPDDVRYTKDHEWAQEEGDVIVIGISDYAQDQLGDIVFAELPAVGDSIGQGEEFGTLESVKAVSEIYMPVGGEIVGINEALADSPELVNTDPYGEGWLIKVKPDNPADMKNLMDQAAYLEMLKGLE